MLSGAVRPGRSPISTATQSAPSNAAMASPIATRPWRTTTSGAMRQPSARSAGSTPASCGCAWVCTARADSPSATTNTTSWRPGMRREHGLGIRPRGGGRDRAASDSAAGRSAALATGSTGNPSSRQIGGQARLVERFMHRVAGAGMGELEVEQRPGRKRRAGALAARCARRSAGAGRSTIHRRALREACRPSVSPAAARGSGSAIRAGGCGWRHPSGPAASARPRTPAPGGGRAGRAWRARRGTRCSDSRA